MKYPMKEQINPFSGNVEYVEMTSEEYLNKLTFYREYIEVNKNDNSRRIKDYVDYLIRWFGNFECDGWDSADTRIKMHQLPMSANVYMFH